MSPSTVLLSVEIGVDTIVRLWLCVDAEYIDAEYVDDVSI